MIYETHISGVYESAYKSISGCIFKALIVAIVLVLTSCENEISKIKTYASTEDTPSGSAKNFEMLYSDSTVIRTKLQTPELIRHDEEKEPYTEFPQGVKLVKYDSKMNVISSITALYAKNYTNDDRWEAKNNVVAVNQNGDTLKTEYLVWDSKKGRIYSDQFVRILRKDMDLTGTGFSANQDFSDYNFKNPSGPMYIEIDK